MTEAIIVAAFGLVGTLLGAYFSNRKSAYEQESRLAQLDYRMGQLETKVDKHNHLVERTYKLEEQQSLMEEKVKVANHRIEDLEMQRR